MSDLVVSVIPPPNITVVTDNTRVGPQGVQGTQGIQGAQVITAYIFDGGTPFTDYSGGPAFDCGGVN